jgi:hypothetical protein
MTSRDLNADDFTDLAEFKKIGMAHLRAENNVIKSVHVVQTGVEEIHRDVADQNAPDIIVHRNGDSIVSIDFVCKCGHSASIRLAYDEE